MEKQKLSRNEPTVVYFTKAGMYLNITSRCDNNCIFCLSGFAKGIKEYNLMLEKEPSLDELLADIKSKANEKTFSEIVYCGLGEPLLRLDDTNCTEDVYNCGNFTTQAEAQIIFDYCKSQGAGDIHRLDADGNGKACEGLG